MDGEVCGEEHPPPPEEEGHHVGAPSQPSHGQSLSHTSVFPLKEVFHWIPITPDSFLSLETNILFLCLKKKT